jgi:phosphatidate cytidylyltransferase
MKQRIITGLILAPIGIAIVLFLPTMALAAFTAITVLVAMWECTRMAGIASRPVRSGVVAIVLLALAFLWMARGEPLIWYVIAAGVVWWVVAFAWLRHFSFGAAPTRENASIKLLAGLFATLPAWILPMRPAPNSAHSIMSGLPFLAHDCALALVFYAIGTVRHDASRAGRTGLSLP